MILASLSLLWGAILERRARDYASGRRISHKLSRPTVSVGNITFGGTGKTPFVEVLARHFQAEGRRPAILSRGYRRRSRGPVVVSRGDGPFVSPDEGGDEPVALARKLPGVLVVVAERRQDAAREAARLGADLFLLDDGYQHLAVRREANLLLLDGEDPFGGGRLPPAGRLREPLSALGRADAIVFTRLGSRLPPPPALEALAQWNPRAPIFTAQIRAAGVADHNGTRVSQEALLQKRFIAVSGIAKPSGFSDSIRELNLAPQETFVFSDHHRYGPGDLERIRRAAERTGSDRILTTEKDAVKLQDRLALPILTMRLEVEIEPAFFPFLAGRLKDSEAVP